MRKGVFVSDYCGCRIHCLHPLEKYCGCSCTLAPMVPTLMDTSPGRGELVDASPALQTGRPPPPVLPCLIMAYGYKKRIGKHSQGQRPYHADRPSGTPSRSPAPRPSGRRAGPAQHARAGHRLAWMGWGRGQYMPVSSCQNRTQHHRVTKKGHVPAHSAHAVPQPPTQLPDTSISQAASRNPMCSTFC